MYLQIPIIYVFIHVIIFTKPLIVLYKINYAIHTHYMIKNIFVTIHKLSYILRGMYVHPYTYGG